MTGNAGWGSTAAILLAFSAAGLAVWYGPVLLETLGLGVFAFMGQVCAAILALSVLEAMFNRLQRPEPH